MTKLAIRKRVTKVFLNNRLVHFGVRLILGGIFIYASIDKIAYPEEFRQIVNSYNILPIKIVGIFSLALPLLELFLGTLLIINLITRLSSIIIALLLIVFTIALISKYLGGGISNCGCFSILEQGNQSIVLLILREILLMLCCCYIIFANRQVKPVH
jgi:putative oxidoreductase